MRPLKGGLSALAALAAVGCMSQPCDTQPVHSRVDIPDNIKVVGVTWESDDEDVWIFTRPMRPDETPVRWQLCKFTSSAKSPERMLIQEHAAPLGQDLPPLIRTRD